MDCNRKALLFYVGLISGGDVIFVVRLATPVETGMDSELRYSASAELMATYQQLSEFSANFIRLIRGEIGEIRLG
ncbi:hypothetical protein [Ralstonia pseudosolanacearum]